MAEREFRRAKGTPGVNRFRIRRADHATMASFITAMRVLMHGFVDVKVRNGVQYRGILHSIALWPGPARGIIAITPVQSSNGLDIAIDLDDIVEIGPDLGGPRDVPTRSGAQRSLGIERRRRGDIDNQISREYRDYRRDRWGE